MSTPVEKIKERLGIVEVIESYMKLDRAGANLKGRCPFHNEKTPSFFVSPDRGTFYCFGCSAKGDIFSFVQQFEGLDFMGSLRVLAQRAGVELVYEKPEVKTERELMYNIMEEAAYFYEKALHNTGNLKALEYVKSRGLKDETIKAFRIGYAENDWRTLYNYLKGKSFTDAQIEKVGLIKRADDPSKGFYDRFRGRIMFPITDSGGRVIAFTGRIIEDDGKSAKYLNSPDTPLFNKANVLYGIDKAKLDIRKKNYTILVEGQMDLIMSHQAGITNTVAVSGTALSDSLTDKHDIVNNLGMIKRLSSNLILVFDSDKAGVNAASRSAQIGLSLGMDVKICALPFGKDPAELILKDPEEWKNVLRAAMPVVEFQLTTVLKEKIDPRKLPQALTERVLPFIAVLGSHMEKAHFVAMIKERTGIAENAIWEDLKKVEKDIRANASKNILQGSETKASVKFDPVASLAKKADSSMKKVLGILYWQERQEKPILKTKDYLAKLKTIFGEENFAKLAADNEPFKNEIIFEAEVIFGKASKLEEDLDQMLIHIEEDYLREEFTVSMVELSAAERDKDNEKAMKILARCQELTKRLAELTKNKK